MVTPLVTVAVPTWNRADLLFLTIRSVLAQTLTDFELFVLDNASTDHTADVVKSFEDVRLHHEPADRQIGLYRNLTRCLRIGTAPYIAICQDDDLFDKDHLERLVGLMADNPGVGLAHAAFRMIDGEGHVLEEKVDWFGGETGIESGESFIERSLASGTRVNMSSALLRRSAVHGLTFVEEDGPGTDLGLWLRIALRSDIAFCSDPLTSWRLHQASVSTEAGINNPVDGPGHTFDQIANLKHVKRRFLAEFANHPLSNGEGIRVIAKSARVQLLNSLTRTTRPRRAFLQTLRQIVRAVRIEPSLLWHVETARVLLASLAGERGRRLVQLFRR